jgi:hypothetical protein
VVHVEHKVDGTWQRGIGLDGHPRTGPTALAWGDGLVGLIVYELDLASPRSPELSGPWLLADGDDRAGRQTAIPRSPDAGLAQTYNLMGESRGPGRYDGTLTLTGPGPRYDATWKIGKRTLRGLAMRHGMRLYACWADSGETCSVGLYTEDGPDTYRALTALTRTQTTDTTTLTRRPPPPPPPHSRWLAGVNGLTLGPNAEVRASACVGSTCATKTLDLVATSGPTPEPPATPVDPTASAALLADSPCGDSTPLQLGKLLAQKSEHLALVCLFDTTDKNARARTHETPNPAVGRLLASPPGSAARYLAIESFALEGPETTEAERPRSIDVLALTDRPGRRVARLKGTVPQPLGAFAPDGSALLALELDGTLHLAALPDGRPITADTRYQLAAFAPDGSLWGVTLDGRIQHLDPATTAPQATLAQVHGRLLTPLVFAADGRSVTFATRAGVHLVTREPR